MVHFGGKQKVNFIIAPLSDTHFYAELKRTPYKKLATCIHRLETHWPLNIWKYVPWLSVGQEVVEKKLVFGVGSNFVSYL